MDERNYKNRDPWEPGMYETGRTRPPKSHGGLIALLLVIVIFLCGLVSVLGMMNVRLFAQLNDLSEPKEDSLSFINDDGHDHAITEQTIPTECASQLEAPCDPDSFVLNPSPDSVPNLPQDGMVAADLRTSGSRKITVRLGTKNAFKTGIQGSLYFGMQCECGNRHDIFFLLLIKIKKYVKANCVFFQDNDITASFSWQMVRPKKVTKKAPPLSAQM